MGLPDKVHELGVLVTLRSRMAVGMDLLKQEGHVRGQRAHGLHTLGVELHFALAGSVGDVPVLRGHHGHVHHLEHHVHGLERGRSTAAPAAAIVAFLIKSLLSISLVVVYSKFFLNLGANAWAQYNQVNSIFPRSIYIIFTVSTLSTKRYK